MEMRKPERIQLKEKDDLKTKKLDLTEMKQSKDSKYSFNFTKSTNKKKRNL
jgi:hypothetical protein